MAIAVTSAVLESLLAEAYAAHLEECCGILFGEADTITACRPAANVHPSPQTHFEIDPQALIDAHRAMRGGGSRVVGYYHSHAAGRPQPSATDRAMAAGDGMIWAIIGGNEVRLWRDTAVGFSALSYTQV